MKLMVELSLVERKLGRVVYPWREVVHGRTNQDSSVRPGLHTTSVPAWIDAYRSLRFSELNEPDSERFTSAILHSTTSSQGFLQPAAIKFETSEECLLHRQSWKPLNPEPKAACWLRHGAGIAALPHCQFKSSAICIQDVLDSTFCWEQEERGLRAILRLWAL